MPQVSKAEVQSYVKNMSYRHVATLALFFVAGGAVFYHYIEDWRWLDALYFTFITLATVGYGDFSPKTDAGKIFTMFYVLFGVTIFIVLAKVILAGVAVRAGRRAKK